jgi:energy-coupling factor transport system ATP-binding protein
MEIRVERVSYAYPDGTRALAEISLSLRQGECAALVGTNGAGKTTLVRHLNGLLKPGSGDVWVGEWNTRARTVAFLSRWVGYAYQNPDDQLFCSKVWDEVAFGPRNLRLGAGQIDRQVRQALSLTGLEGRNRSIPSIYPGRGAGGWRWLPSWP